MCHWPPVPHLRLQVAVTQAISGTGALRIGGAFLGRFYPHTKTIYLPTPSWGNHTPIFRDSGLEVKQYRYFDKKTVGLDFAGLKDDLKVRVPSQRLSTWSLMSASTEHA